MMSNAELRGGHLIPRLHEPHQVDSFAAYQSLEGQDLVRIPSFEVEKTPLSARPRLVVLMPHLRSAHLTGGPNTALNLTARLTLQGINVCYVATFGPADENPASLMEHLRKLTGLNLPTQRLSFVAAGPGAGPLLIRSSDVFLATWWPTAHVARAAMERTGQFEFVYLIQDFEPGFYAWSTKHVLALMTYAFPCRAIVNESFLLDHLCLYGEGIFGEPDTNRWISFQPAVDRSLFRPLDSTICCGSETGLNSLRRLLFYARPKNERNLFDLGLRALREVAARGVLDSWRCRLIGHNLPTLPLSDRVALEPTPWLDYGTYAAFLSEYSLLLSLMLSPHTSYPPLEMAATGGRVITNTFSLKTRDALASLSPAIRATTPDIYSLAEEIQSTVKEIEAITAPDTDRWELASALTLPNSWTEAFQDTVPWLVSSIESIRRGS